MIHVTKVTKSRRNFLFSLSLETRWISHLWLFTNLIRGHDMCLDTRHTQSNGHGSEQMIVAHYNSKNGNYSVKHVCGAFVFTQMRTISFKEKKKNRQIKHTMHFAGYSHCVYIQNGWLIELHCVIRNVMHLMKINTQLKQRTRLSVSSHYF